MLAPRVADGSSWLLLVLVLKAENLSHLSISVSLFNSIFGLPI